MMLAGEQPVMEPLVLIPGMMADGRQFMPQIARFSGSRAVMVAPPVDGDRIEVIAHRLIGQLPDRCAVVGLGLGGVVALEILRQAPERIARLCLMAMSPLPETPAQASEREPQIIGARTGRLEEVLGETLQAESLAPSTTRRDIAQSMMQMGLDLGGDVFVSQSRALQRRPDMQATLRRCKVPALVLCGEYDQINPIKRAEFMAGLLPQGELIVLPHAAHLPPLEDPLAVNAALSDWLLR